MIDGLPVPVFSAPWAAETVAWSDRGGRLVLRRSDGFLAAVEIRRCVYTSLRGAYPVAARDVEVRVTASGSDRDLSDTLGTVAVAIRNADPKCRKVVYPAACTGSNSAALRLAAERAGFRHTVDIDLAEVELSLLVSEPEWVTEVDLERVPGV